MLSWRLLLICLVELEEWSQPTNQQGNSHRKFLCSSHSCFLCSSHSCYHDNGIGHGEWHHHQEQVSLTPPRWCFWSPPSNTDLFQTWPLEHQPSGLDSSGEWVEDHLQHLVGALWVPEDAVWSKQHPCCVLFVVDWHLSWHVKQTDLRLHWWRSHLFGDKGGAC